MTAAVYMFEEIKFALVSRPSLAPSVGTTLIDCSGVTVHDCIRNLVSGIIMSGS